MHRRLCSHATVIVFVISCLQSCYMLSMIMIRSVVIVCIRLWQLQLRKREHHYCIDLCGLRLSVLIC